MLIVERGQLLDQMPRNLEQTDRAHQGVVTGRTHETGGVADHAKSWTFCVYSTLPVKTNGGHSGHTMTWLFNQIIVHLPSSPISCRVILNKHTEQGATRRAQTHESGSDV